MAPVETEYYDLLGVPVDADDTALKKAYRKQAMKYHPDKNPSADAEEKFKDIRHTKCSPIQRNMRAVYDKNGKSMVDKEGGIKMEDAAGFFANVFGGERFVDYIGEISIMKDMTSMATTMMTEEEKAEIEKQMNSNNPSVTGTTPPAASVDGAPPSSTSKSTPAAPATAAHVPEIHVDGSAPTQPTQSPASPVTGATTPTGSTHMVPHGSPGATASSITSNSAADKEAAKKEAARRKAEQREKLREHDLARRKAMAERVAMLTKKMIERIRPFVEAKDPGGKDDPESNAFAEKMKREVEDLKLESFGVELLHTIGSVYMMKASSFMKSKKFLGMIKEKGTLAKDVWGVIGSALSVRDLMLEMEKAQAKGDVGEEELRALEMDVTGKIMLASWRGARLEVIQVLREVVENVLKEPGQPESVLMNRAKALLITGAIFKAAVPDESDEERRELERMVHEAAQPKSKKTATNAAKAKREEMLKQAQAASSNKET
ncbi:hypothetical protein D9613_006944 [Agrocybe pediades]|uniref:J domain-containing protein n=1 Tax=Agrocybe pediades TaxID=84607 RepID=A0A8H4QGN5_9AGAR|nr:hypothetical protein D9613_006944 [Agrocybe pediades]